MLILKRKIEQSIFIGDDITVKILGIEGDLVRLGIQAPREVSVHRQEVYEAIKAENQAALLEAVQKRAIFSALPREKTL